MAALAALGGVVCTYVNAIGDASESVLGFAGTTQWAAGLRVLWLTLVVGLTRKQGAGTITGILKGGVELLTGHTRSGGGTGGRGSWPIGQCSWWLG
jgi:hypothetical protein